MGLILDTCIWVGLTQGHLDTATVVSASGEAEVYVSAVSLGELRFGVETCADPALRARRAAALRQIEQRPTLDVTRHTAAAFGILAAALKQSGRSPRPRCNDLWIAAQAIESGHGLMTSNPKDFADLPGLQIVAIEP